MVNETLEVPQGYENVATIAEDWGGNITESIGRSVVSHLRKYSQVAIGLDEVSKPPAMKGFLLHQQKEDGHPLIGPSENYF